MATRIYPAVRNSTGGRISLWLPGRDGFDRLASVGVNRERERRYGVDIGPGRYLVSVETGGRLDLGYVTIPAGGPYFANLSIKEGRIGARFEPVYKQISHMPARRTMLRGWDSLLGGW